MRSLLQILDEMSEIGHKYNKLCEEFLDAIERQRIDLSINNGMKAAQQMLKDLEELEQRFNPKMKSIAEEVTKDIVNKLKKKGV